METVIRKELEQQELELVSNTNQSSWRKLIGFQQSTIEEKFRRQCVKELDKLLINRQQLDRQTKNKYVVRSVYEENYVRISSIFHFLASFDS
jgi:hypothetical protein